MQTLILIALATVFYTLYDAFASKAGNKIDSNLSSVIFNGLGAIVPLLVYAYLQIRKQPLIPTTKEGIAYSILAGVSIAIFSILFIKIFQQENLSYVVPLIYGGTIVLASLLGIVVFHDKVSVLQGTGLGVIVVGVALVILSKV